MANFNVDMSVSVYGETQSVDIQNFGRICFLTDDVEAGFTENYRIYESNNAAQTDSDLSATAKLACAAFFSQSLRPPDLMIGKATTAVSAYDSISTDLTNILTEVGGTDNDFYGVATQCRDDAESVDMATWALANDRLAMLQSSDTDITGGTTPNMFDTLLTALNARTAGVWHDDDAEYADLTWLAAILSCDMDNQSSVAHDKQVTGVTPPGSSDVDDTKKAQVLAYGGNLYLPLYGSNVFRPGKLFDTNWIEDLVLEDWTKARLQEAFARLVIRLSNSNSKVPYDDFGIALCEAEIRGVIDKGVQIGHFVEDSLTLDVPKLADISAAVRATKTLTISGNVQKAGAVKDITFTIGITF